MPKSLTGDPHTDQLVPVVQQLAGAIEDVDPQRVAAAFAQAAEIAGDWAAGAVSLAVVAAAMVPTDKTPSELLGWWRYRNEYQRLIDSGVSVGMALQLTDPGEAV